MSQQIKLAEMDLKQSIMSFTKLLLARIAAGDDVTEQLEALNALRANAGMKPIEIPQQSAEPKHEAPRSEPHQRSAPRSESKSPSGGGTGMVVHIPSDARMLPDNNQWTNRFQIKSESSGALYTIAQNIRKRYWGCDCPGWISRRKCKHLRNMGLPAGEEPFEAKLKQGSKTAAELMHSDDDLGLKTEVMEQEAHIPGPEAGPSNDELHENAVADQGVGAPIFDGVLKSPERQNVNAIREALDTQVEMEVGKPISQKQDEVAAREQVQDAAMAQGVEPGQLLPNPLAGPSAEIGAKPGTQIIINVASEKEAAIYENWCDPCIMNNHPEVMMSNAAGFGTQGNCEKCGNFSELRTVRPVKRSATIQSQPIGGENQPGATAGHAGGAFGGTDLEGPTFHVGFVMKGYQREVKFSSFNEADKFIKEASKKFGKVAGDWTMKCPWCGKQASKDKPEDDYKCECGWNSSKQEKKSAAVDPAQKQLVLEFLKTNNLTTGEVEKRLGGGTYSNKAYPILMELAKEGLVKHKQMRWYLKQADTKQAGPAGYPKYTVNGRIMKDYNDASDYWTVHGGTMMEKLDQMTPAHVLQEKPMANKSGKVAEVSPVPLNKSCYVLDEFGDVESATNCSTTEEVNQFFFERGVNDVENIQRKENAGKEQYVYKRAGLTTLRQASVRLKMAEMGVPEKHALRIAIQTLKMPDAMIGVMGGPDKASALKTLERHGLRWDDADYMAGGSGIKRASKTAGDGMAKTEEELQKEAGFNFFFPGQVLKEFYPEIQHEIVDYPNATNQPMSGAGVPEMVGDGGHELEGVLDEALDTTVVEMIQLPADVGEVEPMAMAAADYSSTSPAGGMGIGRDGKPEVLEGAPLRKENDIRGYMFTDEFYGQYEGIPGAAMQVATAGKTAAGDEGKQFKQFLKLVCGEIAATMVAAFKVTARPLLDKVPGVGELELDQIELSMSSSNSAVVGASLANGGGRVKYMLGKLNDSEIKDAINEAWAQAAVWNDNPDGGFVYEVFVRPETIDTDSMKMTYKFICGTRG